jgi:hypothetical protein
MKPFIDFTSEETIIAEANDIFGENVETIEEALNVFANNSEYDEIYSVEGSEPENAVRICQWILWTDSQGNMIANDYGEEHIATYLMECYSNGIENPGGI